MLKSARAISSIPKQLKVAEKLDAYIDDFLDGKIEKFTTTLKKPELAGKKIIWQYWHQEINENTPKIVVECLNSVKKYRGDYEVIMLNKKNLNDFIELPDFVWEKFGKNGFNFAKLANLVRLYLLSAYGGIWLDATIYLTKNIDEKMLNEDFFAFQRSKIPPSDYKDFIKFDPLYFSWNPKFLAGMLNSFMIAKPNNKIIGDLLSILLEYWRKEKKSEHYFFFQICFNRMIIRDEWKNLNCEIIGDTDCHKLQIVSLEEFDSKIFDEIKTKSDIHKLTYRFDKFNQVPDNSFLDFIAKGELK
jgi:hypothetical protein